MEAFTKLFALLLIILVIVALGVAGVATYKDYSVKLTFPKGVPSIELVAPHVVTSECTLPTHMDFILEDNRDVDICEGALVLDVINIDGPSTPNRQVHFDIRGSRTKINFDTAVLSTELDKVREAPFTFDGACYRIMALEIDSDEVATMRLWRTPQRVPPNC